MKIIETPNTPSKAEVKLFNDTPQRTFESTSIEGASDINEVLSAINIGEYSQEPIPHICKGYSVIKDDFGNPLSIVSSTYDLLQPIETFGFLDALQDKLNFKYRRAGFTNGGRNLYINADLGEIELPQTQKRKKGDIIQKRITAVTSFDGTQATQIKEEMLRVWCSNGMARWVTNKENRIVVRHSKNQRVIMEQALEKATGIRQVFQRLESDLNVLNTRNISDDEAKKVIDEYLNIEEINDASTRMRNRSTEILNEFHNEHRGTFGETAYDLLNAFTAWNTHIKKYRDTETTKGYRTAVENKFRSINDKSAITKFRGTIKQIIGV